MKKIPAVLMFLLLIILTMSCASTAAPAPAAETPPVEPAQQQPAAEPAPPPPAPPPPPPPPQQAGDIILEGAKTYQVAWGDTLAKIAKRSYGRNNGYYFPLILLASHDTISDPDKLLPGTRVIIPDLQRNLNNPAARQKLKEFTGEIADLYRTNTGRRWSVRTRNQLRALAISL